jgi:hypothetical protein
VRVHQDLRKKSIEARSTLCIAFYLSAGAKGIAGVRCGIFAVHRSGIGGLNYRFTKGTDDG